MNDLTLLFITAGTIPPRWEEFHTKQLEGYNMITLRDEEKTGAETIYKKMLKGAKMATTPFVAVIEDDVLYPPEHFTYRPPLDTFAYNMNRWGLFTWGVPTYNWRNRKSNAALIAPRELLIEALEERFEKNPDGWPWVGELGRGNVERALGVTPRKAVEWFSKVALVQINHDNGSDDRTRRHRKELGPMRAFDIPVWGKAEDVIKLYS